ncbi:MAG: glutamine--fructose-6-phosphate transaminase (isomerizing) [Bryobacteraceae bacterium]
MCGIFGYIGAQNATPIILDGLQQLEYRGYDSAGLAVHGPLNGIELRKAAGKLRNLRQLIDARPANGTYGIGHTRWATHGCPSDTNSHPHHDCTGDFAVVHNGIIENFRDVRTALIARGHRFLSHTDTEVIAHLVEHYFDGSLEEALRRAMRDISGVYAVAFISSRDPRKLVAARSGPPVVIGLGDGELFLASDIPAILRHIRRVILLEDGDLAVLRPGGLEVTGADGRAVARRFTEVHWDAAMVEKRGYRHYMLKEIHEQPRAVRDTLAGRVDLARSTVCLDELPFSELQWSGLRQVRMVACGTSWHAALAGRHIFESLSRIPVEVEYASEFRYRAPLVDPTTLTVVISQSGETADTIAAQRLAISLGSPTVAICNVPGSMVTRLAAGTVLTQAGPEIGVASTKAFTAQLTALSLLAVRLGQARATIPDDTARRFLDELASVPARMEAMLGRADEIAPLVPRLAKAVSALYLGRGIHFPIALEGALKLKEISYIHAEGYPAGEMKHGPNALIDENLPVVILATRDRDDPESTVRYERSLSTMQEVKARHGYVVAVATDGDTQSGEVADHVLYVPTAPELLLPLVEVIPLQLLAYRIAVHRGCDVDQPRNLAKSVTVE